MGGYPGGYSWMDYRSYPVERTPNGPWHVGAITEALATTATVLINVSKTPHDYSWNKLLLQEHTWEPGYIKALSSLILSADLHHE